MENYKQKYEHLAKSIKDLYPYMLADCKEKVKGIILELEMSEDEKIRKGLIDFLKSPFVCENITDEKVTPWIDWLEKQGSKEETLKEHNICDTCEDSNGCLIPCCAKLLEKQGKETQDPCEKCNHPMLNCCNFPCIQKKAFDQGKTILDVMNEEKADNQNCVKTAWSEEDENMWARVINEIEAIKSNSSTVFEKNIAQDKIDWLKSLKERVQPQNFTVTDEELAQAKKNAYNDVLDKIEYHSGEPTFDDGWSAAIDFFQKKSLRPQPEQLKGIEKKLTYKDVARELFKDNFIHTIDDLGGYAEFYNDGDEGCHYRCNATSKRQFEKLRAINMLMNVAKYLNDGWQPDWRDVVKHKYYISMLDGEITVGDLTCTPGMDIYFKSEELANKAIEILGEETIRLALCTDY